MNVVIKQWPFAMGAAAGAVGTAMALAAVSSLGPAIGGALAFVAGAAAAGAGAWLAARALEQRIVEILTAPVDGSIDAQSYATGHPEIDELIGSMKQSLT